jgi:peptidoglycan/xylan/chitin deacetylase (PgdA/CDA1 family)
MNLKKAVVLLAVMAISIALCFASDSNSYAIKPVQVPVLVYHHFAQNKVGIIMPGSTVTADKFRNDMKMLKDEGYSPIFFSELEGYISGGKNLPSKPVMITFDDGYLSNYEIAYPILRDSGMKADIFVIGWCVGIKKRPDGKMLPRIAHFSWDDAREMEKSGCVEVQSHTYDLHNMPEYASGSDKNIGKGILRYSGEDTKSYTARISKDFMRSISDIKSNLGDRPMALAYPFGVFSKSSRPVTRSLYSGSFAIKDRVRTFKSASDLYDIPRIIVRQNTSVIDEIDKGRMMNLIFPWIF